MKTIFQTFTKTLLYHSDNPEKVRVLLLGPTGISAVNINGTTIHSGLGITSHGKCNKLGDKQKTYLRNKLSELKVIIIDEISMVSSELFYQVHSRLIEIFDCKTDEPFAGIPIIVCGDLYQLPPVKGVPIYLLKDDRLETLASYNLWSMFSLIELTEVMRQKDDLDFIQLLNKIRVGNVDEDVENKLKSRFIEKTNKVFRHDKLHRFAENEFVNRHNKQFLECLSGDTFKIDAIDAIPVNCDSNESLIQAAQNQKLTNTGGLAKLKIGVKNWLKSYANS